MKFEPKNDVLIGRIVDIQQSKGGLALPTSEIKNVTVLLLVDSVGPDVKSCKVGDIILYEALGHAFFRDGSHLGVVRDGKVLAVVTDLDMSTITIEGDGKRVDGTRGERAPFTPPPQAG